MLQFDEYKVKLNNLRPELDELDQALGLETAIREVEMLESESASDGFWDNLEKAQKVQQRVKQLRDKIEGQQKRKTQWDDLMTLCELGNEAEDETLVPEVEEGFAKLEAEIAELEAEEKAMFLEELGVKESGLDRLVKASYTLLGLISYLTSGEDECRAWTITKGTKAPQAAGKIHSDFERGFIRAEVVSYEDLMACGTMAAAREKGLIRSEGKEYVVQDGDIILFRFNV